jgi:sugar O-acyltransferase (sialic acid O-acetyltransferase NeuD family)
MSIVVIGAGGHARVILDILTALDLMPIAGLLDDAPNLPGSMLDGHAVLGPISILQSMAKAGTATHGALGIGNNAHRERIFAAVIACKLIWPALVHPRSIVSPRGHLGAGTVVCAGSVVNPGTRIGVGCIINTSAAVDHDCLVDDFAHIGPGATLAGNIHIGAGSLVGAGATIIPGIKVGKNCIVGAGATVITDVPDGVTVAGCPARSILKRENR